MLVLSRNLSEIIRIGPDILLRVVEIIGEHVKLEVHAPGLKHLHCVKQKYNPNVKIGDINYGKILQLKES